MTADCTGDEVTLELESCTNARGSAYRTTDSRIGHHQDCDRADGHAELVVSSQSDSN